MSEGTSEDAYSLDYETYDPKIETGNSNQSESIILLCILLIVFMKHLSVNHLEGKPYII